MILNLYYLILTLTLLCCKFVIATNHSLFGVNFFSLIFGLLKENDILQFSGHYQKLGTPLPPSSRATINIALEFYE